MSSRSTGLLRVSVDKRQIMRIEPEEPQVSKPFRNELGQTLRVRLRYARYAHVLKVNTVLLGRRLSCHGFRANEVRLLLGVIAYNLGNLLRRLTLPLAIQSWSLTSLQQRLFKTGGRLIRHARYFILQLAEGHLTRRLFGQIVGRIERLAWHPT